MAIILEKFFLHQNLVWFINLPLPKNWRRFFLKMTLRHFGFGHAVEKIAITIILAIIRVSSSVL